MGALIGHPELEHLALIAGSIAGMLSVGAFVPQAWRIFRRRSAVDISLAMYLALIAASLLWMFYAYILGAVALFFTNLVIGMIAAVIAALRLRYGGRGPGAAGELKGPSPVRSRSAGPNPPVPPQGGG